LETMLWNEYDAESTEMSDPAEITATETRHNASTEVIGFLDPAESKDDSGSDLKHSHTDLLATVSSDTTEYDTDSIEMSDPADIIVTETSVDLQAVSRDTAESKNEHGTKIKGDTWALSIGLRRVLKYGRRFFPLIYGTGVGVQLLCMIFMMVKLSSTKSRQSRVDSDV